MKPFGNATGIRTAEIIESRSPAGRHDTVLGWHNLLKDILSRMAPYLREGHLITFRSLKKNESKFFEDMRRKVNVPKFARAIYLPPSVRFQMLYHRPEGHPQPIPEHSPDDPPDEGIILACRKTDFNVVVNTLLAKPPYTSGIDIYDDGRLLAGYVYNTITECIVDMTRVLEIHLQPGDRQQ